MRDANFDHNKAMVKRHIVDRVNIEFGRILPIGTPIHVSITEKIDRMISEFACDVQLKLFGVDKRHKYSTNHTRVMNTHLYPKSWWDYFKAVNFPKWLLNKFPPEFESVDITLMVVNHNYETRICPHLSSSKDTMHLNWIISQGNDGEPPKPPKCKMCPSCRSNMKLKEDGNISIYICKCGNHEVLK